MLELSHMANRVRKAVIPAGGLGTRLLPAAKAVPKEMLPLVDKPAIQYVVEEAAEAGITDVLVVTSAHKKSIEDHFDRSLALERLLEETGKAELAEQVRQVAELAAVHFVRQKLPCGLGHAVAQARHHVGAEAFAVLLPDDLLAPGSKLLGQMLEVHERTGGVVLALKKVDRHEISSYGAAAVEPEDDSLVRVTDLVEKPDPANAPSDLAVIGRYVLVPEVFEAIDATAPGRGGEVQLTDAIRKLIGQVPVFGWRVEERRYDTGNKLEYLKAIFDLALDRPDVGPPLASWLANRVRP